MTTHLVCYADEKFRHAQARLVKSASGKGIDTVHALGPADLRATEFYAKHKPILDQPRGGGYWLWKPYFIRETLRQAAEGDFVLYVDSGAEIVAPVGPLADACRAAGGVLLFANHGRPNRYWTKRDCYVLMGCDTEACHDADQVNAAFSGYIVGPQAVELVEEWLAHCTDPRKLTDRPSECGLPELPDFITHLHDQTILSLLAHLRGLALYRDPTQIGNHMKPPALRVPGEYLDLPYSVAPCDRSPYPTVFNHHRTSLPPLSAANRLIAGAKRVVRSVVPKRWPNPYFTATDLAAAIRGNRETLAGVPHWFDPAADAASQFGYGVPAACRRLLDRPVGPEPTLPDLIHHLADHLGDRLNYLEIGVSVGKTLVQLLRAGKLRTLTGFDIEEVHPNLSSRLTRGGREEWPPSPGSLKRPPSSLTTFADPIAGNRVRYLAGDVFDEACWARLRGRPFNFVFSDALHRPESLMSEWKMLQRYDLLDRDEFVMVWDDLGGYMSLAFDRIADQVQSLAGPCAKLTFKMRGWMGANEYPHQVGVLAKLRNPPPWLGRLASYPTTARTA
ncbi:MAG TPA: hypothetical protein VFG68_10100 [Fimbriiglobus sp.]|nr:hypothetical protein [Fimbriiglobus sp.]